MYDEQNKQSVNARYNHSNAYFNILEGTYWLLWHERIERKKAR